MNKKRDENKLRAYFLKLFGKWNVRDEKQFEHFAKWLIYVCYIVMEAFIILEHIYYFDERGSWQTFIVLIVVGGILLLSEGLKLFVAKEKDKPVFYVVAVVAAVCCMFATSGIYPVVIFVLALTETYLRTWRFRTALSLFITAAILYLGGQMLQTFVYYPDRFSWYQVFSQSFVGIFALAVHFVGAQIAMAFYRQYLKLNQTLKQLDESKKELEKAYAVVAEVTALEERQRIAKEIHDTAGHSITTVIMQTESAKRMIENNPAEAKGKIVAANLQARHALEELRDSVHLLSGVKENQTLKIALENIIHESTDGTGITIRSDIEEMDVSQAKFRFLCNTLKEGISNGLRHGNATAFWFECRKQDNKIYFLLSDNGAGVKAETLRLGFGLSSMRERAISLGGELTFSSEKGEGFELALTLPTDGEH
jgi:signal transduction histidine kinase